MKKRAFALALGTSFLVSAQALPGRGSDILSRIPFAFERNAGQFCDRTVEWVATRNGYRIGLGATGAAIEPAGVRMEFVGARSAAGSEAQEPLPGKVNYLIGNDPKRWIRDVETYRRVLYHDVYDGVDVAWYGSEGQIEYDLVVRPGADTSRIALRFTGAGKLSLEPGGDLRIERADRPLTLRLPTVYQEASGVRHRIEGHYVLHGDNEVAFALADYDKSRALVIDPTLVYATLFGSNNPQIAGVSADGAGNVYIGGQGFFVPTLNGIQSRARGAFIAKFDPTGKTLLYSTYIGGSGSDAIKAIAVKSDGTVAAVGTVGSTDFPLVNAAQTANSGFFALELNPAGNGLEFSTYVGTATGWLLQGQAVAVDSADGAYVGVISAGAAGTSITKFSSAGSEVYTFSLNQIEVVAIAVNAQGSAYLAGSACVTSFPGTPPGARTSGNGTCDAFAAKLKADGSALEWATFLGYPAYSVANAIALGSTGQVYFAGWTWGSSLPVTSGVIQPAYGGNNDGFVASLSADGTKFGFVTYLGGSGSDDITSVTVTSDGNPVVAGYTSSLNFPVASAIQPVYPTAPPFTKSTDSGASFVPADIGLVTEDGGSILPDPTNPTTIIFDSGSVVYLTTNDAASWTSASPGGDGNAVRSLSDPSVLYVTVGEYLYRSADRGQMWNGTGAYVGPKAVLGISPTDPDTVIAFVNYEELRSTNGGESFVQVDPAPLVESGLNIVIVISSPDGSMYATAQDAALGYTYSYKSTDAGLTWAKLAAPSWSGAFALSPANPSILYSYEAQGQSGSVLKSADAGATWKAVGSPAFTPNRLAVAPSNPQVLYGADNQRVEVSTDGGVTWTSAAGPESFVLNSMAINPLNPSEVYVSSELAPVGFIAKLGNDGKALIWSTYYDSSEGWGKIGGVAPAPGGDVWVAGSTGSGSLPVTPDARNANAFAFGPGFLARIADATASCTYSINPTTEYAYPQGFGTDGRLVSAALTAPSGCPWTAIPSDSWIHVLRASGTGSSPVPLDVDVNNTSATRTGTVSIGGAVLTIVEPSQSCSYWLSQSGPNGTTITVTAPPGCPWDVELEASDTAFVTSATTGTGDGTVTVSVPANYSADEFLYGLYVGGQFTGVLEQPAVTLTLAASPSNAGSVTVAPSPVDGVYPAGFPVCLTATPNPGWIFSYWSGTVLDVNGCFAPIGNTTVTANFVPVSPTGMNNRSFVSTNGNDASSCAITAPCRTLTRALAMTNGFGEIIVLGSGDYSPATIAQPVTVSAVGVDASITAASGSALIINTPGNVTIIGFALHGMQSGYDGIYVRQVGVLRLYHVSAEAFDNAGVEFDGAGSLSVEDCRFTDNYDGLAISNASARAYVRRTSFDNNLQAGIDVATGAIVSENTSAHFNGVGYYDSNPALSGAGSAFVAARSHVVFNRSGVAALSAAMQFSSCSVALNASYAYYLPGSEVSGTAPGTNVVTGPLSGALSPAATLQ